MNNIELFNHVTAGVLKHLYESLPRPVILETSKLRQTFEISDADWWQDMFAGNPIGATVKWLSDEGFIRYAADAGRGQVFSLVVLTAKGLAALNRVPDALTPKMTVGERLKELSREASKEVVASLVKLAITGSAL